jgi:hypothetical protein
MRPVVPTHVPKAGLALPGSKSLSLLGSRVVPGKPGGGSFGELLHDPAGGIGDHGSHPHALPRSPAAGPDEHPPRRRTSPDESLDPSARHAAQLAPLALPGALPAGASTAQVEARVRSSLEDLLPALVRKVAWSGDGRRGTVRLELGAGELSGGTLLVQVDEGRVRVRLTAPLGVDVGAWRGRIADRLEARGLAVDSVEAD